MISNTQMLLLAAPAFAVSVFLFLTNVRRYLFLYVATAPIVYAFWWVKVLGLSVVDAVAGVLPIFGCLVLFQKLLAGTLKLGKHTWMYVAFIASFLLPLVNQEKIGLGTIGELLKVATGFVVYLKN